MRSIDKLVEKVKKLLALSSSSNEHEAAIALERAQALLAEHNLSMSDIQDTPPELVVLAGPVHDAMPYRRLIVKAVASMYFCKGAFAPIEATSKKGNKYTRESMIIIGEKHNVSVAVMMYNYLVITVDRLAAEDAKQNAKAGEFWSRQSAFKTGCAQRLYLRIEERIAAGQEGNIKNESGTNLPALASVYQIADQRIADFIAGLGGGLFSEAYEVRALGNKKQDESALLAGFVAGEKISLDTQIGKATAKAIGN